MVTKEEIMKVIEKSTVNKEERISYSVTPEEMQKFNNSNKLPYLISQKKMENDIKCGVKSTVGYGLIEEKCFISETTLKKTINGSIRVTRNFLYKFTIGLHMTIDEANSLFELCGGTLRETDIGDYICKRYLEEPDSIDNFCKQYEEYTGKKISR